MDDTTVDSTPLDDLTWGEGLVKVHDGLRFELAALRREVDAYFTEAGTGLPRVAPPLGMQLRTRCLTFCAAVHDHHTEEDNGGFPYVEQRRPELAPTMERLRREHVVVERLLTGIRELLDDVTRAEATKVRSTLDELAEQLLAHLAYEEAEIVEVLNALEREA